MQVTAWKTVEVECEVEVSTGDIIAEFSRRQDEAESGYWRRLVVALDLMTRIMANVSDKTIQSMPDAARKTLRDRLISEAKRYDSECHKSFDCNAGFHSDACPKSH